jgi:hypothetical protein
MGKMDIRIYCKIKQKSKYVILFIYNFSSYSNAKYILQLLLTIGKTEKHFSINNWHEKKIAKI